MHIMLGLLLQNPSQAANNCELACRLSKVATGQAFRTGWQTVKVRQSWRSIRVNMRSAPGWLQNLCCAFMRNSCRADTMPVPDALSAVSLKHVSAIARSHPAASMHATSKMALSWSGTSGAHPAPGLRGWLGERNS